MPGITVHEFRPTYYHCTLGPHEPALVVRPGDQVVTWCVDSIGLDAEGRPLTPQQLAGPPGALQVLSQVGRARVGNVVDPAYSVVAKFPKRYLPV